MQDFKGSYVAHVKFVPQKVTCLCIHALFVWLVLFTLILHQCKGKLPTYTSIYFEDFEPQSHCLKP